MDKIVIFLDIDGVICTRNSLNQGWKNYTGLDSFDESREYLSKHNIPWPHLSTYNWPFDTSCTYNYHLLQRRLYEIGLIPVTIISSSWRKGFKFKRNPDNVDESTIKDVFEYKGLQICNLEGRTGCASTRGREILNWLIFNSCDYPFISIDDENLYDVADDIGLDKCITPKFKDGFQLHHVTEAINKIRNQILTKDFFNYLKCLGYYKVHGHLMYNNKTIKDAELVKLRKAFDKSKTI